GARGGGPVAADQRGSPTRRGRSNGEREYKKAAVPPEPPPLAVWRVGLFGGLDPRRLLALGPLHDLELDFLSFFQGLEAVHLDRREMREEVFAAFIGRDEAEAFCIVEPLDGTGCHNRAIRL